MRLRHIEIFHAVFVTGSVNGAAKALNVSQPTVSKILKHAELSLGFDLFHRQKGRLIPTEKGRFLFEQVVPVFDQINDLRRYAAMLAGTKTGRLKIVMTPAFGLELMPTVLAKFIDRYPDVSVEVETLHSPDVMKALADRSADIGLVFEAPDMPGLTHETIGQGQFVCLSSEAWPIPPGPVTLADVAKYPLVSLNAKSILGQTLNNRLHSSADHVPESRIVAETYHVAKRLVMKGAGVAIVDSVTALSGSRAALTLHAIPELSPIRLSLVRRLDEPPVGPKQDLIAMTQDELANNFSL